MIKNNTQRFVCDFRNTANPCIGSQENTIAATDFKSRFSSTLDSEELAFPGKAENKATSSTLGIGSGYVGRFFAFKYLSTGSQAIWFKKGLNCL
jgi:hypothetical protein